MALKTQLIEHENKYETKVLKLGPEDPHFTFANMCCDVAIARSYGTTRLLTAERDEEEQEENVMPKAPNPYTQQIVEQVPQITQSKQQLLSPDVCGVCCNYDRKDHSHGYCRGFKWDGNVVGSKDVACDEFDLAMGEFEEANA